MKVEFTEVSETRKHLAFEVPPDEVETEIARVAQGYARKASVPGFRPGKVPATVVRQRFRDQILQDVANEMIPRLVGHELRERNRHISVGLTLKQSFGGGSSSGVASKN